MSKNKNKQQNKQLSPENYIRQKSRNLPIHECLINGNWKEMGMANICISRRHSNGNITLCLYLVDINCLGIKDTGYYFNLEKDYYDEFTAKFTSGMENVQKIEYNLAHNIIYAGLEFAETFYFKPKSDFTTVTSHFLEEDTDDIPIIEIECGKDGKPFYFQGPYETHFEAMQIKKKLENNPGKGNYHYLMPIGFENENETDDETDDETGNPYSEMSFKEKKALFLETIEKDPEDLLQNRLEDLTYLTDAIYEDLLDEQTLNPWLEELKELPGKLLQDEFYTTEMLGIPPGAAMTEDGLSRIDAVIAAEDDDKKPMEKARKAWGDIPFLRYHDAKRPGNKKKNGVFEKLIAQLLQDFPDYSLAKIEQILIRTEEGEEVNDISFDRVFNYRPGVTSYEMTEYLRMRISLGIEKNDIRVLEAIDRVLFKINLEEEYYLFLQTSLGIGKIGALGAYFDQN